MTPTPKTSSSQGGNRVRNRLLVMLLAALIGAGLTFFISFRVFGGGADLGEWWTTVTETVDFQAVLFVNTLVGVSVALFISELRLNAMRVTVTVIAALIFGFLMTMVFNLDSANRFTRGEFLVDLRSEAAPIENEAVDLEYGQRRGDELNRPNVREPVSEGRYTFEGREGDVVTILAYAANRRAEVNLEVALLDSGEQTVASGTALTPEQFTTYEEDVQSERDAVIENFVLPADDIYTIVAKPELLATGTILSEALTSTNLAYEAFLLGPLGRINRWAVWIQDALTLILIGLAIAIAFRARQFSLGAEGQLYFGVLISGVIALNSGTFPIWVAIPLAIIGALTVGFLWGLLPGILKAYLNANELVSTLMLNAIAIRFYELVLTFELKPPEAGYTASANFPTVAQLPPIITGTQVTIAVFLVIVAVILVWLLITRTTLGYEIRAVGANLKFANYGGVNTKRTIMLAMAISGLVAGLAGAHLAMGIHRQVILNVSLGLAFEGVVVALLARNNPLVIPFTGLLYAYLRAGAQFMERDANISFEVVRIIQAVIILLITAEALLAFLQGRRAKVLSQPTSPPTTTAETPRLIIQSPSSTEK
jgi:simple sugar transport system permease protein